MHSRTHSLAPAAVTLVALLMNGAIATVHAQATKPAPGKMPQHQEGMKDMKRMKDMQGMKGMNGMMNGPHHVLAMAYRDNIVTFAKALRSDAMQSKAVNLDVARPAMAEMRRSFDQMQQHHKAQVAAMGDHPDSAMSAMQQHGETRMAALNEHLTALEAELNGTAPDAKKVSGHATEIVKECAGMSTMPAKAKSGHPK